MEKKYTVELNQEQLELIIDSLNNKTNNLLKQRRNLNNVSQGFRRIAYVKITSEIIQIENLKRKLFQKKVRAEYTTI